MVPRFSSSDERGLHRSLFVRWIGIGELRMHNTTSAGDLGCVRWNGSRSNQMQYANHLAWRSSEGLLIGAKLLRLQGHPRRENRPNDESEMHMVDRA